MFETSNRHFFWGRELFYDLETSSPISISFDIDSTILNLQIKFDSDKSQLKSSLTIKDKNTGLEQSYNGSIYASNLDVSTKFDIGGYSPENVLPKELLQYIDYAKFLENKQKDMVSEIERNLALLKNYGWTGEIGEYLETTYGIGRNWEFLPSLDNLREFRAGIIVNNKPYFVSGLGDGIRYALPILISAWLNRGSILLIEEIESNQHPSAYRKLVKILAELSINSNSQLFLTTHNVDVAETIYTNGVLPLKKEKDFRCYHVKQAGQGKIECESVIPSETAEWGATMVDLFNEE